MSDTDQTQPDQSIEDQLKKAVVCARVLAENLAFEGRQQARTARRELREAGIDVPPRVESWANS